MTTPTPLPEVQGVRGMSWAPGSFLAYTTDDMEPARLFGVVRGAFAVSPDAHDEGDTPGFNVGAVFLPMGSLMFVARHGAAAMAICDSLMSNAPEFFAPFDTDFLDWLDRHCDQLRHAIAELGGLPLLEH